MVKPKSTRGQAPARDPTAAPSQRCEAPGRAVSWVLRFLIRKVERDHREDDLGVKDLEQGLERIRQGSGVRGCWAGEGLLLPGRKAGGGLGGVGGGVGGGSADREPQSPPRGRGGRNTDGDRCETKPSALEKWNID